MTERAAEAGASPRTPALWEFVEQSGLQALVACASKNPNAKFTVLLVSSQTGRTILAVKVPTTDAAARAIEAEQRTLVELRRRGPCSLLSTMPEPIGAVEFEGRRGLVMTAVHGMPMTTSYLSWRHTASRSAVAADFAAVDEWLSEFQACTARETSAIDMDCGITERLISRFQDRPDIGDDVACLKDIHARLGSSTVARTAVHGDLWFGNVLLSGGRASGVVDWEAGEVVGEPLRDVGRFAHMYALFLDRRAKAGRAVKGHAQLRAGEWGAGVAYAIDGEGWFPNLFRGFLRGGLARLGVPPARWRDLAMAAIAEVAALADDEAYARRHLELFHRLSRAKATSAF